MFAYEITLEQAKLDLARAQTKIAQFETEQLRKMLGMIFLGAIVWVFFGFLVALIVWLSLYFLFKFLDKDTAKDLTKKYESSKKRCSKLEVAQ